MSKLSALFSRRLICVCIAGAILAHQAPAALAQAAKPKPPTWLWGLDLKARNAGTDDFEKARKFGIEVFKDENNGNLIYISETGAVAVAPGGNIKAPEKPKPPVWVWGLDLKARNAGTEDFDKARKFGLEVFKDENSGFLVYICETGAIALAPGTNVTPPGKTKGPTWVWGLDMKARQGGTDDFDKARKFGIEVFKDENNGALVYICETGSIAVVTADKVVVPAKAKTPTWMWGLDLKARVGGTEDFEKARKFGIEVFKDDNGGNLLFLSEVGWLAAARGGSVVAPPKPKMPAWQWGLDLKARVGGTADFEKARKFGIEVFKDDNSGDLVYICETGFAAVAPAK